jgi:hypothetical protein
MGVFPWQPAPLQVLLIARKPGKKPFALRLPESIAARTAVREKRISSPLGGTRAAPPGAAGSVVPRQGKARKVTTFGQWLRFWALRETIDFEGWVGLSRVGLSHSGGKPAFSVKAAFLAIRQPGSRVLSVYDGAATLRLSIPVLALPWLVVRTGEGPGRPAAPRHSYPRLMTFLPGEFAVGAVCGSAEPRQPASGGQEPAPVRRVSVAPIVCARALFIFEVHSESARIVCLQVVDRALTAPCRRLCAFVSKETRP